MKSVRLLPVVMVAAGALLCLKVAGLVFNGGYVLSGTKMVFAQQANAEEAPTGSPPDMTKTGDAMAKDAMAGAAMKKKATEEEALSKADIEAADAASEALLSDVSPLAPEAEMEDAVPQQLNTSGEKTALTGEDGNVRTEEAVLERLSARRAELDRLERELAMRQNLLDAAEQRLNERIDSLGAIEQRINSQVEAKKSRDDEQFKSLVSMYESMKPKDAAAIFDQLELDTLLRVAVAMNPRKMSPILADMERQKAKDLTMAMAIDRGEPSLEDTGEDMADLPQIVGQ